MTIHRADLASIDFGDEVTKERLAHVTPGDVLRQEFMLPLGLSARPSPARSRCRSPASPRS